MTSIRRIILDITSQCNLQCPMCWGPARKFDVLKKKYFDKNLTFSQIKNVLQFMKDNFDSNILTVNGGEPLIRKDIKEILQVAKKYGYTTTLSTNAILLNDNLHILPYLDAISISIDAASDSISYIMRPPITNQYRFALDALKKLNEVNFKYIKANTVVSGLNYKEILKIGDKLRQEKIRLNTWKLLQYKPVGYKQNNKLKNNLLIRDKIFLEIVEAVKNKFTEYSICSQSNQESGLYIIIGPSGDITIQEDECGYKNPHLGNILTDNKNLIINNLANAVDPIAESKNNKRSYNL